MNVRVHILFISVPVMLLFMSKQAAHAGMIDKEGMKPWEICGLCHNLNGISHMAKFPKLAGQKAFYIEKQLRDFKNGLRTNDGGQMEAIVNEVADEDIPEIARYFSSLTVPEPVSSNDDDTGSAKDLFLQGDKARNIPACRECHSDLSKVYKHAPAIKSQHEDYLEKQLMDFRDGNRQNDRDGVMQGIAEKLTDKDIKDLARYISMQRR